MKVNGNSPDGSVSRRFSRETDTSGLFAVSVAPTVFGTAHSKSADRACYVN